MMIITAAPLVTHTEREGGREGGVKGERDVSTCCYIITRDRDR